MANFNNVVLLGRLTSDPACKDIGNSNSVANFTLAVNRVFKDKEGNKKEETDFIDCQIFGRNSKILEQYGYKGRELFVNGSLRQDSWEDKSTGQKRSKIIVNVDNFQLTSGGGSKKQDSETEPKETTTTSKKKQPF